MLAPYYCTAVLGTYYISSFHYRTESCGVICLALLPLGVQWTKSVQRGRNKRQYPVIHLGEFGEWAVLTGRRHLAYGRVLRKQRASTCGRYWMEVTPTTTAPGPAVSSHWARRPWFANDTGDSPEPSQYNLEED